LYRAFVKVKIKLYGSTKIVGILGFDVLREEE